MIVDFHHLNESAMLPEYVLTDVSYPARRWKGGSEKPNADLNEMHTIALEGTRFELNPVKDEKFDSEDDWEWFYITMRGTWGNQLRFMQNFYEANRIEFRLSGQSKDGVPQYVFQDWR